jgi:hypothetical protein
MINLFSNTKYKNINLLVNNRNQFLWDEIKNYYNIKFEKSTKNEYAVFQQSKNVTFYVDENNLCPDSFTHEMLHVYLSLNEIHINGALKLRLLGDDFFSSILSPNLVEHIGNCLEHIKMLPIYLEMGFDREKFILDYDVFKCQDDELKNFELYYSNKAIINKNAIDPFIGRIVAILADPNISFDYSSQLKRLQKVDTKLFLVITNLFKNWKDLKIKDKALLDDDYTDVMNLFINELNEWKRTNSFKSCD